MSLKNRSSSLKYYLFIFWMIFHKGFCQSSPQQSFRVTPTDVEVVATQNITLPCEVLNQRGQAQWTQHGFAFGFEREIPGVARFKVIGNAAEGVHNLHISNVSLEDDGEYQCQVTPMVPSHAIRASAQLTVLLPPTGIEMMGHGVNSELTVKAGNSITLECLAKDAKPAPKIQWFRGSERLRIEQTDAEQSSSLPKRKSMKSSITFSPTSADNKVVYTCRTSHPALRQPDELSASITFDVQYEPGVPEISGYMDGQFVRAGETKTLTCRSRGGNPLPEVFWYKNGRQIDTTFKKHHGYTVNEYKFEVDATSNNAKYECHVQNVMTSHPKKLELTMRVHFPPATVNITGPDEVNVGDNITLSCTAANSNPPADVSLLINGSPPPGVTFKQTKTPDGGFTTVTNVASYIIGPTEIDLTVNCYAANQPLGTTKLDTKVIIVKRPPAPPIIFGYEIGTMLRKNDKRRLSCRSTGGNPLPDLKWFKDDKPLASETMKEMGSSVSHIDVVLDMTDNGAIYRCEASNSATPTPLSNSTVLTVMYPPSGVKVEVTPLTPKANEYATLTCITAPSSPKANVSWWRDGFEVEGWYGPESPGLYQGIISSYSINISVTADLNKKVFTCQADNGFGTTIHDAIILDIHFSPIIIMSQEKLEVSEGENLVLEASATGNPEPLTYTWMKGLEVVMSGPSLNISKVSRNVAGVFTLEVSNMVGSSYKNVTVIVKSAPVITKVINQKEVQAGTQVSLECHFEGSPTPDVEWKRNGYDMSRTETVSYIGKSVLFIRNVTSSDSGLFECHVKNEVGEAMMPNVQLVVNQKPEADVSPQYKKSAAELGGTAKLICRVKASPEVHFTWFTKSNEPISKDIHPRFDIQPSSLVDDLYTYESILLVKEVKIRDHGFFLCQAQNPMGLITTRIHLEGTTKPDPPVDVKVLNATHDSIHLTWVPGFNGGMTQSFRIRYQMLDSTRILYQDVSPGNATNYWLGDLALGTSYSLSVVAINSKGTSDYSKGIVQGTTLSELPAMEAPPLGSSKRPGRLPILVIVIITLVGTALLVLNVAVVTCFIRRKARKRMAGKKQDAMPLTEIELTDKERSMIARVLASKGESMPGMVILAGSTVGGLLVILNVVLIGVVLYRRRSRTKDSHASSDKSSSKSTTIEMYAPSSYTGTVTGETLSSISEKSRESYANEDSADDYETDAARVTAASTYLIEQLEPPPQYASRAPQHLTSPTHHNDLNMDDPYDENMRRNQYNSSLDHVPGYGTLGRRGQATHVQDGYSVSTSNESYVPPTSRYNTYATGVHQPSPTSHSYPYYNGSLRRNQPQKLHFPKDYIRNGSMGSVPVSPTGNGSETSFSSSLNHVSPTRSNPPAQPMSTFITDVIPPQNGVKTLPLEQRGHLV